MRPPPPAPRASQARAEANLAQATALAERYKPLVEANAISKQEYANAVAAQKQAEADVAVGKASVQTASINLGYAPQGDGPDLRPALAARAGH